MKTITSMSLAMVTLLFALTSVSQADTHTWNVGDGAWGTAGNWNPAQVPGIGDTANIANGSTVTGPNGNINPVTLDLTGNSTFSSTLGAIRLNGASINVASGASLTSDVNKWFDLNNGTLTFADGAVVTVHNWEYKGVNTFNFNLSASGFTTLTPNTLWVSGGKANIANATHTVDMANYTGGEGTITLVDYTGDTSGMENSTFQTSTLNVNNRGAYRGSNLTWNDADKAIKLNVMYPTWNGDGGDSLWSTAANWSGDVVPAAGNTVIISNGDSVTADIGTWPWGMDVTLSGGSDLAQSGGPVRLQGATLDVGSGSTLSGGFWDLNGATISLVDGVSASMSNWEHKGANIFNITLSTTGFSTLTPGYLNSGNGVGWSGATYNIDISNYDIANGETITLIDWGGHHGNFSGTFNPTLNITRGAARLDGTLSFDIGTSKLILTVSDDPVWDGGAGDGLWTSAANWNFDATPIAGDTVNISNGDTVTGMNGNLPSGSTVDLTGNSTLTSTLGAVRLNGATINVASGSTLTSAVNKWFDLNAGTVNFEDGAVNTVQNWEHKGNNTFGFTLSATGFTPLTPTALRSGNNGSFSATWAHATFNIDVSNYDISNGGTVVLMDFGSHAAAFDGTFNPTINITYGGSGLYGVLSFDTAGSRLVLTLSDEIEWDGGGVDDAWTTADNWNIDSVPTASDDVLVGAGASVVSGQKEFSTLTVESGATVTFGEDLASSCVITNAGVLDRSGTWRLGGATITLTGTGSFGANITHLDLNGATVSFEDGASFDAPFPFEHKGANTFNYELSATGFTPLTIGQLKSGGAVWADATYNIDISEYDIANGESLVLMDAASHVAAFDGTFNPTVNVSGAGSLYTKLFFDTTESRLLLTVSEAITWDGGGVGDAWTTAENWNIDSVPTSSDRVLVGSGADVTTGQKEFASLVVESGATVTFAEDGQSTSITNSGTLDRGGVWRPGTATITFTDTGSFGSNITHMDLRGTDLNFEDGASSGARFNFEHRYSNTFGFTLSETGFTALQLGRVMGGDKGGSPTTWADATYNIDISAYDRDNGRTVVLMDFNASSMGGTFDPAANSPTVNITGLEGGSLAWDSVNKDLVLTVNGQGGTVFRFR